MRQLSLFAAGVQPPRVADLNGLLVGPAHLVRREGSVRLSVVLPYPESWRTLALIGGLDGLGLDPEVVEGELGCTVRTAFTPALLPLAETWTSGAVTTAPSTLVLDGSRLRWWCLAAGYADPLGFVLVLGNDEATWRRAGAALAGASVPGTFVRPRLPGRLEHQAYRIVGDRRLARLAELVGPPPTGATGWPGTY